MSVARFSTEVCAVVFCLSGCTSMYAGFATARPKLDSVNASANLTGVVFGGEHVMVDGDAGFVESRLWSDSSEGLDVWELNVGYRHPLVLKANFELGVQADVGVAHADLERFQNSNQLISIGIALAIRQKLNERWWLFGSVGLRHYFDVTDPTICNDGSTSSSTGPGTCSHHGGINHYSDVLGDATSVELMVGVRTSL